VPRSRGDSTQMRPPCRLPMSSRPTQRARSWRRSPPTADRQWPFRCRRLTPPRLRVVDDAAAALSGIDILVNNADVYRVAPVDHLTLDDIDLTLNVDVRAVIVAAQAAVAHMRDDGRIISVGSNLATRAPGVGIGGYAASKAALIGWSKGPARDRGPGGITVNVVHPGARDTDMNPADGPYASSQLSHMAIQRWSTPAEVAALVAFVAGQEAARITGTGLTIDGGSNS
jgi:3-oxoacyl-[acyl-carrier protein] reductase